MAKKIKKAPLKTRNPYKFYRNGYIGCKSAKWASIVSPFVVIFITKFQDYFQIEDGTGGTLKMSLGCILAMFVGGVAIWKETKKDTKDTELSSVLGWAVAWALCYFFQAILNDLTFIMGCALAGQIGGFGFDIGAKNRKYYMEKNRDATIQGNAFARALKTKEVKEEVPYE